MSVESHLSHGADVRLPAPRQPNLILEAGILATQASAETEAPANLAKILLATELPPSYSEQNVRSYLDQAVRLKQLRSSNGLELSGSEVIVLLYELANNIAVPEKNRVDDEVLDSAREVVHMAALDANDLLLKGLSAASQQKVLREAYPHATNSSLYALVRKLYANAEEGGILGPHMHSLIQARPIVLALGKYT